MPGICTNLMKRGGAAVAAFALSTVVNFFSGNIYLAWLSFAFAMIALGVLLCASHIQRKFR